MAKKPKLTAKQEKFCREVVKGKSYSDAFRASYATSTTKDKSVWEQASTLRADIKVSSRIAELQEKITDRLLMSRAEWLEQLDRMAMVDRRGLFDPQGCVKEMAAFTQAEGDLIEGIEVIENFAKVGDHAEHVGYTKKIKLASKRQVMKDYGQARGWLEQDTQPNGPQRIFIRKWVDKEEAHVHLTQHNTAIYPDNGDGDGLRDVPGHVQAGTVPADAGASANPSGGEREDPRRSDQRPVEPICEPVRPELPAPATTVSGGLPRRVVRREILPDLHVSERPESDDL